MDRRLRVLLVAAVMCLLAAPAWAQYTLELNNGRKITVQSYREEGHSVRIYGLGGELSIPRDQVKSISHAEEGPGRGLDLREQARSEGAAPGASGAPAPQTSSVAK